MLHHGRHTLALELPGVGAEATLPVGALELKLELLPRPRAEAAMTEAEVYLTIKRERDAQVEAERRFFAYARAWWQQYVELSPAHASRAVKLFALSELGTQRPVSAFVRPLRAVRDPNDANQQAMVWTEFTRIARKFEVCARFRSPVHFSV